MDQTNNFLAKGLNIERDPIDVSLSMIIKIIRVRK